MLCITLFLCILFPFSKTFLGVSLSVSVILGCLGLCMCVSLFQHLCPLHECFPLAPQLSWGHPKSLRFPYPFSFPWEFWEAILYPRILLGKLCNPGHSGIVSSCPDFPSGALLPGSTPEPIETAAARGNVGRSFLPIIGILEKPNRAPQRIICFSLAGWDMD